MSNAKTIVICTPTVDGHFTHEMEISLAQAMMHLREHGWQTIRDYPRGSNIGVLRDNGVKHALENDCEYILQVDSDTVVPPEAILHMIEHDVDIVSGVYVGKQGYFVPIAATYDGEHYTTCNDLPSDGSLIEVDAVGGGFLLVKTKVFAKMQPPYFEWLTGYPRTESTPINLSCIDNDDLLQCLKTEAGKINEWLKKNPDKGMMDVPWLLLRSFLMYAPYGVPGVQHGEDYGFCHKAKALGFKVWLDTAVHVGHLGPYMYTYRDYLGNKAYRESQDGHKEDHPSGIIKASV